MTTNRILVLISIKTLRPEVEDYWLSIPPVLQTIDSLKRFVLMTESIGGSADDIGLYLNNGLLREKTSIDCLRDRDCIRILVKRAAKRRINSLLDTISENSVKCKCSVTECITIDEFDAESVNNGSAIKLTTKLSKKVMDTKFRHKSMVTENKDNKKSAQKVTGHEFHGSIAGDEHSLYHRESQSFHEFSLKDLKELSKVNTFYGQPMASDWSSSQHSSTVTVYRCDWADCTYTTSAGQSELTSHRCGHGIDVRYMCVINGCGEVFNTFSKRTEHHLTVHPMEFPDVAWIHCSHDGCLFAT